MAALGRPRGFCARRGVVGARDKLVRGARTLGPGGRTAASSFRARPPTSDKRRARKSTGRAPERDPLPDAQKIGDSVRESRPKRNSAHSSLSTLRWSEISSAWRPNKYQIQKCAAPFHSFHSNLSFDDQTSAPTLMRSFSDGLILMQARKHGGVFLN